MLLGQILVRKNLISNSQLTKALDRQNAKAVKLGEVLLQDNLILNEQLEEALKEQYWRRNGFWVIEEKSEFKVSQPSGYSRFYSVSADKNYNRKSEKLG